MPHRRKFDSAIARMTVEEHREFNNLLSSLIAKIFSQPRGKTVTRRTPPAKRGGKNL